MGGAFIHNLITGKVLVLKEPGRFTPYHLPHSTEVAGLPTIYSGDDRYYNNVFVGKGHLSNDVKGKYGLENYNESELRNFMGDNIYYHGAKPCKYELSCTKSSDYNPRVKLEESGDNVFLLFTFDERYNNHYGIMLTTNILGIAKIPKAPYENPDGSPLNINQDYFGNRRSSETTAGPFTGLPRGEVRLKVW